MKNLIRGFVVCTLTLFLFVLGAEVFFRNFSNIIPTTTMVAAPGTEARSQFLGSRGIQTNTPRMSIASTKGGREISVPLDSTRALVDPEDANYGAIPFSYREEGFCNLRPAREIPAVITAVGDSFTYCVAVKPDNAWSYLLGGKLNVTTMNLGIPGQGLHEYYEILKSKLSKETKIVVVGVYEGNDLRDGLEFVEYRNKEVKKSEIDLKLKNIFNKINKSFIGKSYLYTFVVGSIRVIVRNPNVNFSYDVAVPEGVVKINTHSADSDEVHHAQMLQSGEVNRSTIFNLWSEPIGWIMELAKERNFQVLWIYIPSAYTAYDNSVRFHDKEVGELVRTLSKTQRDVFAQLCKSMRLNCLDTVAHFQRRGSRKLTHFPANIHLTPFGHEVIADAVSGYINMSEELSPIVK